MPQTHSGNKAFRRIVSFIAALGCVAIIWLSILPRLGEHPVVRELVERNEAKGIDPSAKFYTEHPGMAQFMDNIETAHRHSGHEFWLQSAQQRIAQSNQDSPSHLQPLSKIED
ncbi:hypothetical protein [Planctomicrobium sp. SH527]|uniref:hypothetical protein n=1 Tax=Planctomicrobium sp. SH527 TaxID=3448123 RepID=UPI003F5B9A91